MDSRSPHNGTLCFGLRYQDSVWGSFSYQHVVIPINLTSLTLQANSLDGVIQFYEDQICDTYDNADPMNHSVYKPSTKAADYAYMNRVLNTINMAGQYNVTNTHCLNLKSLLSRIQDLKELFPNVDANAEETTCQLNHHQQFIEDFKKKIIDFSNVRWRIMPGAVYVVNVVLFSNL